MAEKTTIKPIVKKKSEGTSIEVYLSVYKYKGTPVSVVGIKNEQTNVSHDIAVANIPADGWFGIVSFVKTMSRVTNEVRNGLINEILNNKGIVSFPVLPAVEQRDYADLNHEIIKKFIEV